MQRKDGVLWTNAAEPICTQAQDNKQNTENKKKISGPGIILQTSFLMPSIPSVPIALFFEIRGPQKLAKHIICGVYI